MDEIDNMSAEVTAAGTAPQDTALLQTLGRLLAPLARLCLANGVTFANAEEILKKAFVEEANALHLGGPSHGTVSRISTATGIARREVTRLVDSGKHSVRSMKPTIASEIFTRWTTDTAYRNHDGSPSVLKRQGVAPSFEALAQTITRDVHPRTMLEELVRLGIAGHDVNNDTVSLTRRSFVPQNDFNQLLGFLGDNVGDHFEAAVANVLNDTNRHHEQAVFADELSGESIEALRPLVAAQWVALRDAMVPAMVSLIESDKLAGRVQNHRIRIGLYNFTEARQGVEAAYGEPDKRPKRKNNSRKLQ